MVMAVVPLLAMGQSDPSGDEAAPGGSTPDEGFTPYQTILERMPFGPLPPNFNPDAPPGSASAAGGADGGAGEVVQTEEEQQIVASVRVSVLNKTPAGAVAVGFTDSSVQPPKHYYLKVGEKSDIWEVKDADPAEQTVVLVKNGVEATLKVGEGTPDGKGAKAGKAGGGMLVRNRPMAGRMAAGAGGGDSQGQDARARHPSGLALLRDRRRRSLEDLKAEEARRDAAAAQARKDADQARKDAAQAAAEREQQREALLQIQEELRRQREEREQRAAREAQENQQQGDGGDQSPE
jgi:hypothetical protein